MTPQDHFEQFVTDSRIFQHSALTQLTEQTTEIRNIVQRLDRLNGSVARHEQAIGEIRTAAAVASAKESAETLAADRREQAQAGQADALRKWVQPIMMMFLGVLLTLILMNGPSILGVASQHQPAAPATVPGR